MHEMLWAGISDMEEYKDVGRHLEDGDVRSAFDELYNEHGVPKPRYAAHATELEADRILYLAAFVIKTRYRSGGLGALALRSFHAALRELDAEYAPKVLVLTACPLDERPRPDLTENQEVLKLIAFYTRSGYGLWHGDDEKPDENMMGRML